MTPLPHFRGPLRAAQGRIAFRLLVAALWLGAALGSARSSLCGSLPETVAHGCTRCDERLIERASALEPSESTLPPCHRGAASKVTGALPEASHEDEAAPVSGSCCAAGMPSLCAPLPAPASAPPPVELGVTLAHVSAAPILEPASATYALLAPLAVRSNAPPGAFLSVFLRL